MATDTAVYMPTHEGSLLVLILCTYFAFDVNRCSVIQKSLHHCFLSLFGGKKEGCPTVLQSTNQVHSCDRSVIFTTHLVLEVNLSLPLQQDCDSVDMAANRRMVKGSLTVL